MGWADVIARPAGSGIFANCSEHSKMKKSKSHASTKKEAPRRRANEVESVITSLKRVASKRYRAGMARFGLPSDNALGVPVGSIQKLAKRLGRDHALAAALWDTGVYEARMLACFVEEPERVTPRQMDRW